MPLTGAQKPSTTTFTTKERYAEPTHTHTRPQCSIFENACIFIFRCLRKKVPFLVHAHTVIPHPSPMSSMLMRRLCKCARAERDFFRRQYDPPLFTPPTLKRGGKGRNDSSDVMSMGTFFRRHRYIEIGCWVCRMCVSCLVTHAQ